MIAIELNKESQEFIQNTINKVAENIGGFIEMLEKFNTKNDSASMKADDVNVKSDSAPAKADSESVKSASAPAKADSKSVKANDVNVKSNKLSNEPKKVEPIKSQNVKTTKPISKSSVSSKKKKNATEAIFNIIKKSGGISVEDLKKETGFDSKKIADVLYRLKKSKKIQRDNNNLYIIVQ
ncbi:MAG: hypothetical protein HQK63_03835 [Desulfamplus sp.]|nr:hypothetical protein [Desulfamplus sp.]